MRCYTRVTPRSGKTVNEELSDKRQIKLLWESYCNENLLLRTFENIVKNAMVKVLMDKKNCKPSEVDRLLKKTYYDELCEYVEYVLNKVSRLQLFKNMPDKEAKNMVSNLVSEDWWLEADDVEEALDSGESYQDLLEEAKEKVCEVYTNTLLDDMSVLEINSENNPQTYEDFIGVIQSALK